MAEQGSDLWRQLDEVRRRWSRRVRAAPGPWARLLPPCALGATAVALWLARAGRLVPGRDGGRGDRRCPRPRGARVVADPAAAHGPAARPPRRGARRRARRCPRRPPSSTRSGKATIAAMARLLAADASRAFARVDHDLVVSERRAASAPAAGPHSRRLRCSSSSACLARPATKAVRVAGAYLFPARLALVVDPGNASVRAGQAAHRDRAGSRVSTAASCRPSSTARATRPRADGRTDGPRSCSPTSRRASTTACAPPARGRTSLRHPWSYPPRRAHRRALPLPEGPRPGAAGRRRRRRHLRARRHHRATSPS